MKENSIHVVFVVDESGSMTPSQSDVIGGFKSVVDEQRKNVADTNGTCLVSYYKFATNVQEVFKGKNIDEVDYLTEENYRPGGLTAMNDGIGIAIDNIGKWLDAMSEDEKPEKNLVVIITDGEENNSKEYTTQQVRDMIKHQEEKYSWSFIYLGTDITTTKYADSLGVHTRGFASRSSMGDTYAYVNTVMSSYLCTSGDSNTKAMALNEAASSGATALNTAYEAETGNKIDGLD